MKIETIFRKAAKRIAAEQNHYCCVAIGLAAGEQWSPKPPPKGSAEAFFAEWFKPTDEEKDFSCDPSAWWPDDDRDTRVLALLFAAEMAKELKL